MRGAKRRSNLIRDCFGFPLGNLAMTKEEQGVASDSLMWYFPHYKL
ncbi:MAG: hypothetical protein ACP5QS_05160 [bacterium]